MTKSLDFNKIKSRINSTPISSEEALKDITPIDWDEAVLTGEKKVVISHITNINNTDFGVSIMYV